MGPDASREERVRRAVVGALAAATAVAALGLAWWRARPRDPAPPREPSNPAILIAGGRIPRMARTAADTIRFGPRATRDEGLGGAIVPPFWIQTHEVTNEEYGRFDRAHVYPPERARHPVVRVTWEEAMTYALSLGGRLPDEREWELAARGTSGRAYPWGDAPPTCERAHFGDCEPRTTLPVMSRPAGATPDGVHDLAGNVWEWVMPTWFVPGRTPVNEESRRMRGGSYVEDGFFLRATNRNNGFFRGFRLGSVGFRVAWPAGG